MYLVRLSKRAFQFEIIVLAGLLVLVGGLAVLALRPPPARVDVTSVTWTAGGTQLSTGSGWKTAAGSQATLTLGITNLGGAIDYTSATLAPPGFRVLSASLPEIAPGASGNLTIRVSVPDSAYTGPLTIELA